MRLLLSLRRRRFERYRFVGQDALVAKILDGESGPPELREMLDEWPSYRVYPIEGGYSYKWRHTFNAIEREGFMIEVKGWDHEHCDACGRTISMGGTAWLTKREPCYQLCPYCFRRVRQLGHA